MEVKNLYMKFKTKWTGRVALFMSLLYLTNPFYKPLNAVFHETIALFESPNMAIGHNTDRVAPQGYVINHEHEGMVLENSHDLIDFVGSLLENSEETQFPEEQLPKSKNWDKHITSTTLSIVSIKNMLQKTKFCSYIEESKKGHPIKTKEPPKFS